MILTRLDVVNDMLACLGELPMNSLEEGHPLGPTAIRALDIANSREQTKGWWFNMEVTDLVPDTQGYIYVPNDTIRVDPVEAGKAYVQRGRKLYKPYEPTLAEKWFFDRTVRVKLTRLLDFEDLPSSAQNFVSYSAQLDFMKSYEADSQKYQQVTQLYRDSLITINSEHTRAVKLSAFNRRPIMPARTEIGGNWPVADYYPHP